MYCAARIDAVIEVFERGGAPVGRRIHHVTINLAEALAHEHEGEAPAVLIIPAEAWGRVQESLELDSISTAATPDVRDQLASDLEAVVDLS